MDAQEVKGPGLGRIRDEKRRKPPTCLAAAGGRRKTGAFWRTHPGTRSTAFAGSSPQAAQGVVPGRVHGGGRGADGGPPTTVGPVGVVRPARLTRSAGAPVHPCADEPVCRWRRPLEYVDGRDPAAGATTRGRRLPSKTPNQDR